MAQNLDPLRTSFEQKPQRLRAKKLYRSWKNCSKNENTAKSTGFWLSFWKNWCVGKEITDDIENYEPAELNTFLEHFYAEVNNIKKVKIMNQKALK